MVTSASRTRSRVSSLLDSGTAIAVGMGVMNVATYGFTIAAARLLGPHQYGAVASLMATLLVLGVLQLGLQATAARRISQDPAHVSEIERSIMGATYRVALTIGGLALLLTPVLDSLLRLDSWLTAAMIGVSVVPLTIMGGQAGVLQGERRWRPLALVYVAAGVPRLVLGLVLLTWQPTATSAAVAVAIASFAPVAVGWVALRAEREQVTSDSHDLRRVLRETVHNSQALFAFFALSNADVIVARQVLTTHESGLYAAGLILTKAMLFLPQFVVVVAFPSLATQHERRRALGLGLGLMAVLGGIGTLASWLLADLALVFVGGDKYAEVSDRLWCFALLGTALSMLQLLVYAVLAGQERRASYALWLGLIALVGLGLTVGSVLGLLVTVLAIDLVVLAVLSAYAVVMVRRPDTRIDERVPTG